MPSQDEKVLADARQAIERAGHRVIGVVRPKQDVPVSQLLPPEQLAKIPPALRHATLREGRVQIQKMLDRVGRSQKRPPMRDEDRKYRKYLGDGVYAEHDGWHVVLRSGSSVESDLPQAIFLDPGVLAELMKYVTSFRKEKP